MIFSIDVFVKCDSKYVKAFDRSILSECFNHDHLERIEISNILRK